VLVDLEPWSAASPEREAMAIDTSRERWTGSEAADLDEYLMQATTAEYPADRVEHARCTCGGTRFRVEVDDEAGCALRTCAQCGAEQLMLDSAEFWEEADPEECECPCGAEVFELAVAFSHREDHSLKWVTLGLRCVACGALGVYADWKIDYEPTGHLYAAV
jgi:hypothetical protein